MKTLGIIFFLGLSIIAPAQSSSDTIDQVKRKIVITGKFQDENKPFISFEQGDTILFSLNDTSFIFEKIYQIEIEIGGRKANIVYFIDMALFDIKKSKRWRKRSIYYGKYDKTSHLHGLSYSYVFYMGTYKIVVNRHGGTIYRVSSRKLGVKREKILSWIFMD